MAKLGPRRWSTTRAWIAGVLAWLLALQGFAFAASPHADFAKFAAGTEQILSPDGEYCGAPKGGDQHPPGHYDHCQCCLSRAPGDAGGLAWIGAAIAIFGAVFPAPAAAGVRAWRSPGGEKKPPSGWTSSWSQRAPPHLSRS